MSANGPVVAGHQPNFLPWFGYFEKMLKSDIFVYSDDVQYPKQSYTNRVEIAVGQTAGFLTLPVMKGGDARIADKQFVQDDATCKKLVKTLRLNLGGLPHFADIQPVIDEFEHAYRASRMIADFNIRMNQHIAQYMGITTPVLRGTALGLEAFHRNERLVQRCRVLHAGTYLCGQGADGYQDEAFIADAGIALQKIDYAIGRELFGEDLRYSVLQGIARQGIAATRAAIATYRAEASGP